MPGVVGIRMPAASPRWLMGVQVCDAPHGYDNTAQAYAAQTHIVEWHLAPAKVRRLLPSGQVMETLPPSGFIVRPAHAQLGLVASGPARFVHFCIGDTFVRTVAVDWLGDTADRDDLLRIERVMCSDASIQPMLDHYLRRALDEEEPPTRLEMDSRAHLVMLQLLKRHSALAQKGRRVRRSGGLAPYQLHRVCELMTQDLAEEVPLSELAAAVGLSYHHFCHAFKASMGLAPHQWLVGQRVEKACELLRTTRESVTEIAAFVGYDDPNQLLRVFRARRGTTPVAYRRQFQGRST
ncbi:helix-turn-helix domain-containing protein [Variovorax sp. LjRoot178]|uniref:helix-turn-helix domain-containing protein n=1 Tax=Variovorax sp. LjRoot178 TaxID=3342277 RepID=UPI003ECE9809